MAQNGKPKKTPPGQVERWEATLDENTCDRCRDLDGQEFPKGEGPEPPIHEHCRCRRRPAKSKG